MNLSSDKNYENLKSIRYSISEAHGIEILTKEDLQIYSVGISTGGSAEIRMAQMSLPYPDEYFDFIYARLVLHYLQRTDLVNALNELYRVLKKQGKIFVVVRSDQCQQAHSQDAIYNPETGMTTYTSNGLSFSRYFHGEQSIENYLKSTGFNIHHVKSYKEQLCIDFQRAQPASLVDILVEVLASK